MLLHVASSLEKVICDQNDWKLSTWPCALQEIELHKTFWSSWQAFEKGINACFHPFSENFEARVPSSYQVDSLAQEQLQAPCLGSACGGLQWFPEAILHERPASITTLLIFYWRGVGLGIETRNPSPTNFWRWLLLLAGRFQLNRHSREALSDFCLFFFDRRKWRCVKIWVNQSCCPTWCSPPLVRGQSSVAAQCSNSTPRRVSRQHPNLSQQTPIAWDSLPTCGIDQIP